MPHSSSPRHVLRASGSHTLSTDEDGGTYFNFVVKLFDVRYGHSHAPVRRGAAERGRLFGPVDPGAFVDRHPTGLDRVRGTRGDHLAGEVPGPVGFRHV